MTLPEQIEYINKIKDKVTTQEKFTFNTVRHLIYVIENRVKSRERITFSLPTKSDHLTEFWITIVDPDARSGWLINCSLEDFLSNYFGDIINPTPEEKVMWRLQFGFDWFF